MLPKSKDSLLPVLLLFENERMLQATVTSLFLDTLNLQSAHSAKEGMKLIAQSDRAAVAIFDDSLDTADSLPLFAAFTAKFPDALTVLLTRNTTPIADFNLAGPPNLILQKPASPHELRAEIFTYLDGLQAAQVLAEHNSVTTKVDKAIHDPVQAAQTGYAQLATLMDLPKATPDQPAFRPKFDG